MTHSNQVGSPGGGIVRLARRPAGWCASGPPPPPPPSAIELWPQAGEDLCFLSGEWRILQRRDGHRWSLDDLMTAWLAAEVMRDCAPGLIADLGCGIGSVLMMLAWRFPAARLVGIEAQPVSVDLARRSLAWNGIEARCEIRLGDLRESALLPEAGACDLVTGTPPYFTVGRGTESQRVQFGPCHFEYRGGVAAYCQAAARLLRDGGRFVFCAAAVQREQVEPALAAAGLQLQRTLDVVPRAGKPTLFSLYVTARGAEVGAASATESLIVRDEHGRRTAQFRQLRAAMGMPP